MTWAWLLASVFLADALQHPLIQSPASAALSGGKQGLNHNRYLRFRRSNRAPSDAQRPQNDLDRNLDRGF